MGKNNKSSISNESTISNWMRQIRARWYNQPVLHKDPKPLRGTWNENLLYGTSPPEPTVKNDRQSSERPKSAHVTKNEIIDSQINSSDAAIKNMGLKGIEIEEKAKQDQEGIYEEIPANKVKVTRPPSNCVSRTTTSSKF